MNLSKKKLLNSAMTLFCEAGYESTSTRKICQHAGVNLSLIPYYFGNKEGLYISLIETITNYAKAYLKDEISRVKYIQFMTEDEKVDSYYRILKKYSNLIYSDAIPYNFIMLMLKEQTNQNSKFSILYLERMREFYNALIMLISEITGIDKADKNISMELFGIIGQILSQKLTNEMYLNFHQMDKFPPDFIETIKSKVDLYIKQHIETLRQVKK